MFKIPSQALDVLQEGSLMTCKSAFKDMDMNKFRVISRPEECIVVLFYQRAFSNFAACGVPVLIDRKQVFFPCGEAMFKCACAAFAKDWEVFTRVFTSATPLEAKMATKKIKDFDKEGWDAISYQVMLEVQRWKACDVEIFNSLQLIHELSLKSRVKTENVIFMEATSKDALWGTGIDVQDIAPIIESSNTDDILSGSIYAPSENRLGIALTSIFQEVAGKSHEDFLSEVSMNSSLFVLDTSK